MGYIDINWVYRLDWIRNTAPPGPALMLTSSSSCFSETKASRTNWGKRGPLKKSFASPLFLWNIRALILLLPEQLTSFHILWIINGLLEDSAEVEWQPTEGKDYYQAKHRLGHFSALQSRSPGVEANEWSRVGQGKGTGKENAATRGCLHI